MFGLGTTELIIILVILLMVFGVGKLPMVAKQLGGGVRDFRKAMSEEDEDDAKQIEDKAVTNAPTSTSKSDSNANQW
jgi:sec-independent protein translocase protein TatA